MDLPAEIPPDSRFHKKFLPLPPIGGKGEEDWLDLVWKGSLDPEWLISIKYSQK